jgi:hypothetical protein
MQSQRMMRLSYIYARLDNAIVSDHFTLGSLNDLTQCYEVFPFSKVISCFK